MIPYLKKALSIGRKVVFALFILFGTISLLIYFSQKDKLEVTDKYSHEKTRAEIYQTLKDPELNSTKEGKTVLTLYRGLMCGTIGEACTDNPNDGEKNFNRSMFGYMANVIALPYTSPPASGVYWAYEGLQNAGFVPQSHAAEGIGVAAIRPFYKLWAVFRNIAYSALVIVIVVIGLLIMFRVKVDPHTVIKLENSLPRIVVSLIMITFSFAIAGFMIDLMYLVMAIIISQLSTVNIGDFTEANKTSLLNTYLEPGFYDIYPRIGIPLLGLGRSILGVLPDILQATIRTTFSVIGGILMAKLISSSTLAPLIRAFSDIAAQISGGALTFNGGAGGSIGDLPHIPAWIVFAILFIIMFPWIGPFLISMFIFFTLFFLMIRVFFLLLRTYVTIILFIVFSPVILLLGALPGKNHFFNWIKNLAVHILIFPVILTIILVGSIISKIGHPDTPVWRPPFLYGLDPDAMSMLIGIGMILIIPDLVKAFKERMGIKPTGISFGLGTFFGAAAVVGGGAAAGFSKFAGLGYQMSHLSGGPLGRALQGVPGLGKFTKWLGNTPTQQGGQPGGHP